MCGIAGIISSHPYHLNMQRLQQMSEALIHRGPDGDGVWMNTAQTAGLAHRRLAIIDLSTQAAQPMHYLGRYSIVYNGELYNYIELREELKKDGYSFSSKSDTEVILAAYDCYREKCLQYFEGMFSFAIWDEQEQSLFAARDRFGEKPFFYYNENDLLIFASEMKAIWSAGIEKQLDEKMVLNYLTLGYNQNPEDKSQTFYKKIDSLPPAHYLLYRNRHLIIHHYWDIDKDNCIDITEEEAAEQFDEIFSTSLSRKLRSDVPLGTSLSGGLDSSTILYYMKRMEAKNFQTFSAIFPGFEKDESEYIKKVVTHLGVVNHPVVPNIYELIDDFEKLVYHQEEPFSSSSIYAQYRVFKEAREKGVTVLLDGQGADEMLAGYHKYAHWYLQEMINRYKFISLKNEKAKLEQNDVQFDWGIRNYVAACLPSHAAIALERKEYKKIRQHHDISKDFISALKGREWEGIHKPVVSKLNDILYFNMMESGLEELLRYSDRNSMAHGCEVRLPFLDHRLVSFVFSLPSRFKINNGYTKSFLRKLMNNKLPDEIVWRKDKIGYEPPQQKWMDNKIMQDYVFEAKKLLVRHNILSPESLKVHHPGRPAHDANNFDWRYLCIAEIMRKG